MRLKILNVRDVAESGMCCGCGACAYTDPQTVRMVDDLEHGRRPMMRAGVAADAPTPDGMRVCPGIELRHTFDERMPGLIRELRREWGPVLQMWEGHATDEAVRFGGSSGGAASALSLWAIERGGMHGLLHIAARKDVPYLNHTVLSRTREEILAATGSRYAPASPCDGLGLVEAAPRSCVMIGKPCDVAAASAARRLRPGLDEKLGLTIAIFCAGTPSTKASLQLMKQMGVEDLSSVRSVRYRGNGWPGMFSVVVETDAGEKRFETTYAKSWGFITRFKQWRCRVCADHTGEFADVSVGDPWYRPIPEGEIGQSLVMARTPRGVEAVRAAMAAGYLKLTEVGPEVLLKSQPNLLTARGSVWGRSVASRLFGAAAPRYQGLPTFPAWLGVPMREKVRSLFGTARRVWQRKLWRRVPVKEFVPPEHGSTSRGALGAQSEQVGV